MTDYVSAKVLDEGRGAQRTDGIRPLGLAGSLLHFWIPAGAMVAAMNLLWPYLVGQGFSRGVSYTIVTILVMTGLIVASLISYVLEGGRLEWRAFAARMRLGSLSGRAWLWTLGSLAVFLGLSLGANQVLVMAYRLLGFTPPDISSGVTNALLLVAILPFNVLGEELWWRGIILPRQELAFGKAAWVTNGLLWATFHAFKWWAVPAMMITCLVVPFIAQRTRSTWPGIVLHFVLNASGAILLFIQRI
jgi:membrane protease YdiL (CAAX protease family)